ncbi:hypothetical protein [Prescottella agglutinans]|uniref:DUF202 domain-containing protein n=1 Tax=Prescottella agglutinans TaxID=1644129 RepID=A0ABT6MJT5_9NOCA|nr:hypothetical protein [Prescottella agglutinans]MDH6284583.1 hypothetical protein [Prescottella agglutinans]
MDSNTTSFPLQVRRSTGAVMDRVGHALTTRTRARVVLWLTMMIAAASLSESGISSLARFGSRLALICLGLAVLELAGAAVVWAWRRLRLRHRRRRGGVDQ